MLKDKRIGEFVNELSDKKEIGSESLAALSGSLGAALISAVKKFSEDKEFYKNFEHELKLEMDTSCKRLSEISDEMLDLMELDRKNLEKLIEAYKMPQESEDEKIKKVFEVQNAYKKCLEIPLRCANLSLEAMFVMEVFSLYGNPNMYSDIGAANLLLSTAAEISILNIQANLNEIKDEEYSKMMSEKITEILGIANETKTIIMNRIYNKMLK